MNIKKIVTRSGLTFSVLSSRERTTTHGGRHFKCTGRDCAGWTLVEHDRDITVTGNARPFGRKFERLIDTNALVDEIKRLVDTGDQLPTDIRPPWEIDEDRHVAHMENIHVQRAGQRPKAPA